MANTKSHTFTAVNFAIREPGRPPGNCTIIPPSGQPRNDETIHKVSTRNETNSYGIVFLVTIPSNFRMKTNSNQAQEILQESTVWLKWLISRISICFQMILNNLVWSFFTSLKRRKAILQKLSCFQMGSST